MLNVLSPRDRIDILMEEYRSLYGLAQLRIGALDRRSSVAVAALATFLGAFGSTSPDGQLALLIGLPPGILWFVRTTQTHAQAFEDALRRIDQIEQMVNSLAGAVLLGFQSSHPSRRRAVGGRTGAEAMSAAVVTSMLVLAACGWLGVVHGTIPRPFLAYYAGFLGLVVLTILRSVVSYCRYRYTRASGLVTSSGSI